MVTVDDMVCALNGNQPYRHSGLGQCLREYGALRVPHCRG
jgi:hypothetical protein